jgi:regulator of protease activity HflC (stomatin/prohibitin superfamily)
MSDRAESPAPRPTDPHRVVVLVLLAGALVWMVVMAAGAFALGNPAVLDVALALWIAFGVLTGVAVAQAPAPAAMAAVGLQASGPPERAGSAGAASALKHLLLRSRFGLRELAMAIASVGVLVVAGTLVAPWEPSATPFLAAGVAGASLLGAWLASAAAGYLAGADPERFPSAPGLARGARVLAWGFIVGAAAVGLQWGGWPNGVQMLHGLLLALNVVVCVELSTAPIPAGAPLRFPTDLRIFSILGSRANPLASALDAAQRSLGIDLRSTWALTVVRQSAEPLLLALCVVGWLATALTVVAVDEQALVERFGVPVGGEPLRPGLHLHWPWPVDSVSRIPVRRIQTLHVGHEGEEEGPEDVLWARQHAKTEYTLLLGNGRDLIAIDAAVQFRIVDASAWRYHTRNPADALRAIAYRAVMKATVDRTLADALSQNVATLTAAMSRMVQSDADALGLGIEITAFTVGGMHPPVNVAADYQAVVSAELGKTTAAVAARAYANELVPKARAEAVVAENTARADGAESLGTAAGEAWSFRAVESEYHAAPEEYRFRRRLETLESGLGGRRFVVLDRRIQRDGGEIWLMK